jgi:predicted dienelactone hydrolase
MLVALLRRSLKYVAVSIGVLLGLLAVAAASVFAYGEAESDRVTALPEPTAPYAVGRVSYHWTDHSREEALTEKEGAKRELMAFMWYPARKPAAGATTATYLPGRWGEVRQEDYGAWSFAQQRLGSIRTDSYEDTPVARAKARYPVLVMEPGLGPLPTDYTILAEDLASHGYVLVAGAPPTALRWSSSPTAGSRGPPSSARSPVARTCR